MAIVIVNTPEYVEPAYNPFYLVASSTNTTKCSFKFLFDFYTGSTFIGRYKLLPRPVSGYGIFNPNRIAEAYLSSRINPTLIGTETSSECILNYTVQIGEEHGDTDCTTGTTMYTGLTSFSGYAFNGVVQYETLPSWSYFPYRMNATVNPSGGLFLTNSPSTVTIDETDYSTIGFLNIGSGTTDRPYFIRVTTYQDSGGTRQIILRNPSYSATTTAGKINIFGCGIENLNNVPVTYFVSGATGGTIVNVDTDYKYSIQLLHSTYGIVSETKTFELNTRCSPYEPVRLMFLNRLGHYDYFTFSLINKRSLKVKRESFVKPLGYGYTVGQRGKTNISTDIYEVKKITSDWISEETSDWLEELFTSPDVYHLLSDGTYLPVELNNSDFEMKKLVNDKLINYELEFGYCFDRFVQRG